MRNRKTIITGAACAALLALFGACKNNFYHDLIPPDGDRITSFKVAGQKGEAVIGENIIELTVGKDVDIQELIPSITVSYGARIFPLTFEYVLQTFPGVEILSAMRDLYTASDLPEYIRDLIRRTPDFTVPKLNTPIDFSGPVNFFVVAGLGNIRQYTVNIIQDNGEPQILGFRFAKYDNHEILGDAVAAISSDTLTVTAIYPVEMPLSYALIPSFEILGEKLEIDGAEVVSAESEIQFEKLIDIPQTKRISVTREGETKEWTLQLTFIEDPDTVRQIIDFRFNWADNTFIAATAVAAIINDGDFGTITVQVLHEGARPSSLTPRFLSSGTVRRAGVVQTSGVSGQDFSAPFEYRVTSRDGQFHRTYTVRVEFIQITRDIPRMLSFGLSQMHNPGIIRGSNGEIGDGHIIIDVHYGSFVAPDILIPEFSAEGIVTVLGSVQISGLSPQDFSRRQTYRVTNPKDPTLRRDYSIQTRLIRDTSSDALITSFGFSPQVGLEDALTGRIQQETISVFASENSGINERLLAPYFTATGQVTVGGVVQGSGVSAHIFSGPMEYTVVSPNGLKTRTYTVNVREMPAMRVYVDERANGWNDGTSWQNAFRSLKDAADATVDYPVDVLKEVWIAGGMYTISGEEHFPVVPNIIYSGGFSGSETSKAQRNLTAHKTIVSGASSAVNLFAAFDTSARGRVKTVSGNVSFENLEFTNSGTAISLTLADDVELRMTDLRFNGMYSDAVKLSGALDIAMSDLEFSQIEGSGIIFDNASDAIEMKSVTIQHSASGVKFNGGGSGASLSGLILRNIAGNGIEFSAGRGRSTSPARQRQVSSRMTSGITIESGGTWENIGGSGIVLSALNSHVEIISPKIANTSGRAISITNSSGDITISRAEIGNMTGDASGIYISGGSGRVNIQNAVIDNIKGKGIELSSVNSFVKIDAPKISRTGDHAISVVNSSGDIDIARANINDITNASGIYISGGSGRRDIVDAAIDGIKREGNIVDLINRSISAIYITSSGSSSLNIQRPKVSNSSGTAVFVSGSSGSVQISRMDFSNLTGTGITVSSTGRVEIVDAIRMTGSVSISGNSGHREIFRLNTDRGVSVSGGSSLTISEVHIQGSGNGTSGISVSNIAGMVDINRSSMRNVSGRGIYISGGSGRRELSYITGNTISGDGIYVSANNPEVVSLQGLILENITGSSSDAVRLSGGNVTITGMVARNVGNRGVYISGGGLASVLGADVINTGGTGIEISGTSVLISSAIVSETRDNGIYVQGASITIDENSSVTNAGGHGIYLSTNGSVLGVSIKNVTVNGTGRNGLAINGNNSDASISRAHIRNSQSTGISISIGGNRGAPNITNSSVQDSASGISVYTNSQFFLSDSLIKNTGRALTIDAREFRVSDVDFINTLSSDDDRGRIAYLGSMDKGRFSNCTFTHEHMNRRDEPPSSRIKHLTLFESSVVTLEFFNCNFFDLHGDSSRVTYYFSSYTDYWGSGNGPTSGELWGVALVNFYNSRFKFNGDMVGIFAGYTGDTYQGDPHHDYFLVRDIAILSNGSSIALFQIVHGSHSKNHRFNFSGNNNYYEGTKITSDVISNKPPAYAKRLFTFYGSVNLSFVD